MGKLIKFPVGCEGVNGYGHQARLYPGHVVSGL